MLWKRVAWIGCKNVFEQGEVLGAMEGTQSPSAASSPSQEPPGAAAEAELPAAATREQRLLKWPNFCRVFPSAVVVCVASVSVTLIVMAALGIRAFIECPKQISELAQRLMMTNSDFAKALSECYEEKSDLKQQLRNVTSHLIATLNELKDVRKILEEYWKIAEQLREKLGLIQRSDLPTHNSTGQLRKAIQDLKERVNKTWITPPEAENCSALLTELDQLSTENVELRRIEEKYTGLLNQTTFCQNVSQGLRAIASKPKFSSIWDYCSNETFQCAPCMASWVKNSSQCFLLSTDRKSWLAARAECVRLGVDLAVVRSLEEQEFLTALVKNASIADAWIGVSDVVELERFRWVDATIADHKYWIKVPNQRDSQAKHCVGIVAPPKIGEGTWAQSWDVLNCTEKHHYICGTTALTELEHATPPP